MSAASASLRTAYRRYTQGGIAADSVALIVTSGLTAGTGFVFWVAAARLLSPHELGVETAILSLVTTTGTLAAIGTANSFAALLPVPGCDRRERLTDGFLIVVVTAVLLGIAAGFTAKLTLGMNLLSALAWSVVGSVIMAMYPLKDSAIIGLGGASRLPAQNLFASLAKLALLPLFVVVAWHPAVMATLISAAGASIVYTSLVIPKLLTGATPNDDANAVGPTRRDVTSFAMRDGVASAMSHGVFLSLPFITTAVAGPVEGAVFALALTIAQILDLISAGVGTALTTGLSARPSLVYGRACRAWLVTSGVVVLAGVALLVLSPVIMMILGPSYADKPVIAVMAILLGGSALRVSFVVWASVLRAQRRTLALLKVNASVLVFSMPLTILLIAHYGAMGAAFGLTNASILLSIVGGFGLARGGR